MARQLSIIQYKGKLGNTVGFTNSNSSDANATFVKPYKASANPKTYAQAAQRAKVVPAGIFYAAFEPVLNHAFLPIGKASKNRLEFMSKAMSLNLVPDVMKGETFLPELPYQISKGSLGLNAYVAMRNYQTVGFATGLSIADPIDGVDMTSITAVREDLTVGALSTSLIENNPQLVEGMEITFLAVCKPDNAGREGRYAQYGSFVLDKGNTVTVIGDVIPNGMWLRLVDGHLGCAYTYNHEGDVRAFGIIISSKSGSTWRYTNSFMCDSPIDLDDAVIEDDVVASYMAESATRASQRILQQADNTQSSAVRFTEFDNREFTLSPAQAGATLNHESLALAQNSLGESRVIVNANGGIYYYADGSVTPVTKTIDTVTTQVTLAETSLAGNPTILLSELGF